MGHLVSKLLWKILDVYSILREVTSQNECLLELQLAILFIDTFVLIVLASQQSVEGGDLFFERSIFTTQSINDSFEALKLVLFLDSALESALSVLQQSSLSFGKIPTRNFLFNFGKLPCDRSFGKTDVRGVVRHRIIAHFEVVQVVELVIIMIHVLLLCVRNKLTINVLFAQQTDL